MLFPCRKKKEVYKIMTSSMEEDREGLKKIMIIMSYAFF